MKTYKSNLPEITLKYKKGEVKKSKITSAYDTFKILSQVFDEDTLEINESVIVLFLNRANNTIGWTKHSSGGSVSTVIDVKLLMVAALQCGAQSIIVAHNHPSGNVQPSQSDILMCNKINAACKTLDITLLDNLVISTDNYYSFADENKI